MSARTAARFSDSASATVVSAQDVAARNLETKAALLDSILETQSLIASLGAEAELEGVRAHLNAAWSQLNAHIQRSTRTA